jgi:ankyrin repeat protein
LKKRSSLRTPVDPGIGQSVSVTKTGAPPDDFDEGELLALFAAIASRDDVRVTLMLDQTSGLATRSLRLGATRQDPRPSFLTPIRHYVYAGDTALHVAAAAYRRGLAETLVARGAAVRARNRRGAEPLHYAADGHPGADFLDPKAQHETVSYLIDAGADPDAIDKSGVAPLHRAVRTRSSGAVSALIDGGADPLLMNKSGSTPLHLAVQNTGKSNSGLEAAKEEQRRIILLLLGHGASGTDLDAKGKTVAAAASSAWIRQLLGKC